MPFGAYVELSSSRQALSWYFSCQSGAFMAFCRSLVFLILPLLINATAQARVIMDSSCELVDEDIYVLTSSNDNLHFEQNFHVQRLSEIFEESGLEPSFLGFNPWEQTKSYLDYADNLRLSSRYAIMIDPHTNNITLIVISDHEEDIPDKKARRKGLEDDDDAIWVTDNMSYIDGKTNPNADFRCSGRFLKMQWSGRNLSMNNDAFDSAEGELLAVLEDFDDNGQPNKHLRVMRLKNDYPLWGIAGQVKSSYQKFINKRTPSPHRKSYKAAGDSMALFMSGKYRPGSYKDDEFYLAHDIQTLRMMQDESSMQNILSSRHPVTPRTLRSHLQNMKTLIAEEATLFSHTVYTAPHLNDLLNQADQRIDEATAGSDIDADTQLKGAIKQVSELSVRMRENLRMVSNSKEGVGSFVSQLPRLQRVTNKVERILYKLQAELEKEGMRRALLRESRQKNNQSDNNLISEEDMRILAPELFADDTGHPGVTTSSYSPEIRGAKPERIDLRKKYGAIKNYDAVSHYDTSKIEDRDSFMQECKLTSSRIEGVFTAMDDNHHGFTAGLQISLMNGTWLATLKATQTPWSLPKIQTYGSEHTINAGDLWCRGPLFGANHTHGPIRLMMTGIYDPTRNEMYTITQWSYWNGYRVISAAQNLINAFLPVTPLLVAGAVPYVGGPIAALGAFFYISGMLVTMPYSPPQARYPHIDAVAANISGWGLGDGYYNGGMNMYYYSSFSTLRPTTGIH